MKKKFEIANENEVDSPGIIVHQELMIDNIRALIKMSSDPNSIRPHVKTHKTAEIASILLREGVTRFKCSTIAEAEMLASVGAIDILLAYQPDLLKAKRLAALANAFPKSQFSCLVDNEKTAELISGVFGKKSIGIYIDVNVGMNRTGAHPDNVPALAKHCSIYPNIRIYGLHLYDGHIHDDNSSAREKKAAGVLNIARQLQTRVAEGGCLRPTLIMGGSPTFRFYLNEKDVEASPGTFVFWDEGYRQMMPELPFQPAAILITRVVSIINQHTLCLDLGYKSIACESPLSRRMMFPDYPDAQPLFQNEEHLVVGVADSSKFNVGDVWYVIPYHICPTIALHDKLNIAINHIVEKSWKVIARDRFINY